MTMLRRSFAARVLENNTNGGLIHTLLRHKKLDIHRATSGGIDDVGSRQSRQLS